MAWWLIPAIISLVGGTGGLVDSLVENKRARDDLQDQIDNLDALYGLEKKEAGLEYNKAKDEANRNAEEAKLQADLKDAEQTKTEQIVSGDFNTTIDNMYLSQANDAWSWNDAASQLGSSEGAAYSALAGSGVRAGSSLSDAVMIDSTANGAQLQFSQEAKRRSDNNNLYSVLNNLAGNQFGIMQNRIGADLTRSNAQYLIDSYNEGGANWNIYKNNLAQMDQSYSAKRNQLLTEKSRKSGWNAVLDAGASFLTMGASGFKTGYDLQSIITQAGGFKRKEYKTTV